MGALHHVEYKEHSREPKSTTFWFFYLELSSLEAIHTTSLGRRGSSTRPIIGPLKRYSRLIYRFFWCLHLFHLFPRFFYVFLYALRPLSRLRRQSLTNLLFTLGGASICTLSRYCSTLFGLGAHADAGIERQ
ncbi:hypothetical protein F5Y12DRAFT_445055 [Xylaria sp. FL1777]|nr:hypothetical protein F5Y12DRAFT_445055 [Xylaria sp. FL1777]